jgi:hypothetical protein
VDCILYSCYHPPTHTHTHARRHIGPTAFPRATQCARGRSIGDIPRAIRSSGHPLCLCLCFCFCFCACTLTCTCTLTPAPLLHPTVSHHDGVGRCDSTTLSLRQVAICCFTVLLCCTVLYSTVLYCILLYYPTILYTTILYTTTPLPLRSKPNHSYLFTDQILPLFSPPFSVPFRSVPSLPFPSLPFPS